MSFGCSFGAGYRTLGVAIASIQLHHSIPNKDATIRRNIAIDQKVSLLYIRYYGLEDGLVSIQAHQDSDVFPSGHKITSYEKAKSYLETVLTENWPFTVKTGTLDSGPSGWGNDGADDNHNGEALVLRAYQDTIDRSC